MLLIVTIFTCSLHSQAAQAPKTNASFINAVKILRGERSVLKSKAILAGAGAAAATGLAVTSPQIIDPEMEIQLYREARGGIPEGQEWSEDYKTEHMRNIGEKAIIVAAGSAAIGAGVGALYSKGKKHYILSKLNSLLRAYTDYSSFQSLTFAQSALLYAAYMQDLDQLKQLAQKNSDFLNEKGIFNVITSLFYNKHATHDLMAALKEHLKIDTIQIHYLPDILARQSLRQKAREARDTGIATIKSGGAAIGSSIRTGRDAIGSRVSRATKAATSPFRLNYMSEKAIAPYMNDPSQYDAFLQSYNPNILVGTFGGYLTGANATPILGYALWNGKGEFASFLIEHGAKTSDNRMQNRALYNKKGYNSYLDLAIDKKQLNVVKKLIKLGLKIGDKELRRAFTTPDQSIQSYIESIISNPEHLQPGVAPLNIAVSIGNKDLVKRLFNTKNINNADLNGNTPLHIAVNQSNTDLIKLLLESDASVEAKNKKGNTPLHLAKKAAIANLLIQQGASTNSKNNEGKIPLFIALEGNDPLLIKALAQGVDLAIANQAGNSLLHQAIRHNKNDFAKMILQKNPSLIDQINQQKETPLALAAKLENNQMINFLIANNANIESRNSDNATPLIIAISNNNIDGAKQLLSYNADPNATDKHSDSSLHKAVGFKRITIIDDLLKNGASIDKQDLLGNYPLHIALTKDLPGHIIIKLISPTNINASNNAGNTPLSLTKNKQSMLALLRAGADPNIALNNNDTALQIAAKNLDSDSVSTLLQHGARTNFINNQGNLPLHTALLAMQTNFFTPNATKTIGIIQSLISPQIINSPNNDGRTPISIAASIPNAQLSKQIIQLLYQHGARNDIPDLKGKFPHEYSLYTDVRKLLGYIPPTH